MVHLIVSQHVATLASIDSYLFFHEFARGFTSAMLQMFSFG